MSSIQGKRLLFALVIGVVLAVATWLCLSSASPIYDPASRFPGLIGNVLAYLSFPALALGMLASGNVHQPSAVVSYIGVFLQWVALGYLLALAVFRQR